MRRVVLDCADASAIECKAAMRLAIAQKKRRLMFHPCMSAQITAACVCLCYSSQILERRSLALIAVRSVIGHLCEKVSVKQAFLDVDALLRSIESAMPRICTIYASLLPKQERANANGECHRDEQYCHRRR